MDFLLRAEAVNLDNFVYDTCKIQPLRGGSFMLLDSVQKLAEESPDGSKPTYAGAELEKVTTGASIGIFKFSGTSIAPQEVADAVLTRLISETGGYTTFVVEWVAASGNFANDLEVLQAKNRWRQYQQPTLVLPDIDENSSTGPCAFDGIRPGTEVWHDPDNGNEKKISRSAKTRKDQGGKLRNTIYGHILGGKNITDTFTDNLHDLAEDKFKQNLNNKVAFIYFDGNKFSKIRRTCTKADQLTEFSKQVETPRAAFLQKLLESARDDLDFKKDSKIRLETILWGGDELEIIVPAWKGWKVAKMFMEAMKDASYDQFNLTHAGGIIFCGSKAHIRDVRDMARSLAENVKESLPADHKTLNHNEHDQFRVLALESFDTIGTDIGRFASQYYGGDAWSKMQIGLGDMDKLEDAISAMKGYGFPRNKIFKMVRAVRQGKESKDIKDLLETILKGNEHEDKITANINDFLGGNPCRWYLIADLWDYVGGKL